MLEVVVLLVAVIILLVQNRTRLLVLRESVEVVNQ